MQIIADVSTITVLNILGAESWKYYKYYKSVSALDNVIVTIAEAFSFDFNNYHKTGLV